MRVIARHLKLHRLLVSLGIGVAAAGLFAGVAHAAGLNRTVTGITNHTIYTSGDTVTISGVVNGDIFCAAQTVTINATVNGDVICAGQVIDVNGMVNGNVRLAGQTVNLGAVVTRSASLVGQDVVITSSGRVGQDAGLLGQTATINGRVDRDVTTTSDALIINSSIGRNISATVNNLTLSGGARVAGNVAYYSPHTLQRNSGATVVGATAYHYRAAVHHTPITISTAGFLFAEIYWLVALIVLGVVLVALMPRVFRGWNPVWGNRFWWLLLTGFVAMFAAPAIILLLTLSIVGIPLAILVLLLWLVIGLLSVPFAAYFTGSLIVPRLHPVLIVLIGGVILAILELIPILGWIIGVVAYWLGVGTVLAGLRRDYSHLFLSGQRPQTPQPE
jgi:cytoskeletal protein CcmA (bactofilin family)